MRRLSAIILALLVAALGSACSPRAISPVRLVPTDYRSWPKSVDRILDYPIPGHGDNARIIFMDPVAYRAASSAARGDFRFPEGSVIVKEVYAGLKPVQGQAPATLTAMVKASGDPRSRDGWLWVTKDMASGAETVIGAAFCATCHAAANEAHPYGDKNPEGEFRDYVFFLPRGTEAGSAPASLSGDGY